MVDSFFVTSISSSEYPCRQSTMAHLLLIQCIHYMHLLHVYIQQNFEKNYHASQTQIDIYL